MHYYYVVSACFDYVCVAKASSTAINRDRVTTNSHVSCYTSMTRNNTVTK